MVSVPRLFPNSTVVCIGGGPSLLPGDVAQCRGAAHVIAINDAYTLAPWADVLYACDAKWWKWHPDAVAFAGLKFGLQRKGSTFPDGVQALENTGLEGIERSPTGLRTGPTGGSNGGYQAINLAVHLGATRILLLGYDMQNSADGRKHWFGDHPDRAQPPFGMFVRAFDSLVTPLTESGITVINCSRRTALTQFQRLPIERVLSSEVAA